MTSTDTQQSRVIEHQECLGLAAREIFHATCGVELQQLEDATPNDGGVIIALISLVGDVDWSIFLGLPRTTASPLTAKFCGFEIPFDSDDMGDAVGELTNILAGEVKARLDRQGVKANISLPSVIRAESIHVLKQSSVDTFKLCFGTPQGNLWAGITTHKNGAFAA